MSVPVTIDDPFNADTEAPTNQDELTSLAATEVTRLSQKTECRCLRRLQSPWLTYCTAGNIGGN